MEFFYTDYERFRSKDAMSRNLEVKPYTGWQLLKAYWQSDKKVSAYAFLISVLTMSVILVGMDVVFTQWLNYFYNSLQEYQWRQTIDLIIIFFFLAALSIILQVYRFYLQSYLGLRWRKWLTHQFLNRWLQKRSYYYLEEFGGTTDNPDQRIQEDINSLVITSLSLLQGLLSAIITIFAFTVILWELSGVITIPLGSLGTVHIPGYLVWVSVAYSAVGTFLTFKIGRPLVGLNFEQQRREANFRFAAIDLRSHAEHVALYRGEDNQKNILQRIFGGVLENWYNIILRTKLLLWFTAGYNQISVILPLIVALPNYFNKVFKLGGFMQSIRAFSNIQDALSFIVNSYTVIAEWQAVMQRLLTFLNHVYEIDNKVEKQNAFAYTKNSDNKIETKNINIFTPNGEKILGNINETLTHGKHYWITGDSGYGKSTYIRAIAGIWPYGNGVISLPKDKHVMFIPQRAYMPLGTLKDSLAFPEKEAGVSDKHLKELLKLCDLPNLTTELNTTKQWSSSLSPGELQRIAFVRVLLQKPDWVFLDESTSALDLNHEKNMYKLLKENLPHCSVISVGHRPSLKEFHDHVIDIGDYHIPRQGELNA